jgi:putative endonuclease
LPAGPGRRAAQLRHGSGRALTRNLDLGRQAEAAVADLLFAKGYTLLARNLRLGALELDIVARKGALLVVVEVRTRGAGAWARALESVTWAKRLRLRRATGRLWRARLSALRGVQRVRIDVAAVSFAGGKTQVEYIPGAVG